MSWFKDLSSPSYWGSTLFDTPPTAVGWLEADHSFTKGETPSHILRKLCDLLVDNWEPMELVYRGYHACSMCGIYGDYVSPFGHKFTIGCRNLFVPSSNKDFLFAAPSTIVHYIVEHEYLPPSSFLEAVDSCPQMRSLEYLQAIEPHWRADEPMTSIFLRSYGMAYARILGCEDQPACSKRFREIHEEDNAEKRSEILKEAKKRVQHDVGILESFAQSNQINENKKAVKSIQAWIEAYQRYLQVYEEIDREKREREKKRLQ